MRYKKLERACRLNDRKGKCSINNAFCGYNDYRDCQQGKPLTTDIASVLGGKGAKA